MKTALALLATGLLAWPMHHLLAAEVVEAPIAPQTTETIPQTGENNPIPNIPQTTEEPAPTSNLGVGRFSHLPFRVNASVRAGYDDNIFTDASGTKGSAFTSANLGIEYDFGNARTKLALTTSGGLTYYTDRPRDSSPDLNFSLGLTVIHRATARLTLQGTVYGSYQSEPDFAANYGLNRRSGNFFYSANKFTGTFLWTPRFSTATSFSFGTVKYDDSSVGTFADRSDYTFGNEFRYLLWPTSTLVAEYRFGVVDYDQIARDSTTNFFLAGFDHNFSPRLNISVRGGEELRAYEGDESRSSPYFEGTLNYVINPRSSVALTAHYSIEEPDIAAAQSRTTFRTGLVGKYGFTARINAVFAAYYEHDEYDSSSKPPFVSPGFGEDSLDLSLSLRYAITRTLAFEIGQSFTTITSDEGGRDYTRSRYYGGINFSF